MQKIIRINRNIVECKLIRNMERHKVEEMN